MVMAPKQVGLLASLVTLWATLAMPAFAEWRLASDAGGTRVEVRSVEGKSFPEFRGTRLIAASVDDIAIWIRDPETYTRWMQDCVEARALPRLGGRGAAYQRLDLPWPFQDRDTAFVFREERQADGVLLFRFEAAEHPDLPEREGIVRMPALRGHFRLEPRAGATRVEYQALADPGIALPEWLAERLSQSSPEGTLLGLERVAIE